VVLGDPDGLPIGNCGPELAERPVCRGEIVRNELADGPCRDEQQVNEVYAGAGRELEPARNGAQAAWKICSDPRDVCF
jgi:hypothetical protein